MFSPSAHTCTVTNVSSVRVSASSPLLKKCSIDTKNYFKCVSSLECTHLLSCFWRKWTNRLQIMPKNIFIHTFWGWVDVGYHWLFPPALVLLLCICLPFCCLCIFSLLFAAFLPITILVVLIEMLLLLSNHLLFLWPCKHVVYCKLDGFQFTF